MGRRRISDSLDRFYRFFFTAFALVMSIATITILIYGLIKIVSIK